MSTPRRYARNLNPDTVRRIIARAAAKSMTYRYYHWDWGEAVGIEGVWLAAQISGVERFRHFVERMVRTWIAHSPDPWYPDHVGPGRILVEMWRTTGEPRLLGYAKSLAAHVSGLPRNQFGAALYRPDLPDRAQMVWVDSMQTDAPFLCLLASATGEDRWFDEGAANIRGHIRALQDPKASLFHHCYDGATDSGNGVFWGRGNGWAMLGLVNSLELLPQAHPVREAISESLERLVNAVVSVQDAETGLWHTVLNRSDTYLEGSASLMLSCGLMRAHKLGLSPARVGRAGLRAWGSLWNAVDSDGLVSRVSARTPPRTDPAEYNLRPVGGHYPWGQGAYILAAATYLG